MRGITRDTFGRMIDQKGGLAGIVMMAIGFWIVATSNWQSVRITFKETNGALPYATADEVALHFLSTYASIIVGVVCLLAAGIIPSMLKTTTSWYFFARPVSRERIIIEKVWGVVIVYVGLTIATFVPVAVVAALRYGLVDSRLAEILMVHAFTCAAWLTLICALGVLLKHTAKVIFVAVAVWVAQLLLQSRAEYLGNLKDTILEPILGAIAFVLPRMSQLGESAHSIAAGAQANLLTPILMTLLSVGLTLYLALASMSRRDL